MRIKPLFAWYDFWVGVFIDVPKRRLYVFPLPMIGVQIDFGQPACQVISITGYEPHWETIAAIENEKTIGWLVRWSERDERGRYLWVGHYYAGPHASIGWCEVAAESHAKRLNDGCRLPEEFGRPTPAPTNTEKGE